MREGDLWEGGVMGDGRARSVGGKILGKDGKACTTCCAECYYTALDCEEVADPIYVSCLEVEAHPDGKTGIYFMYADTCYYVSVFHEKVTTGDPIVKLQDWPYFEDCEDCTGTMPATQCPDCEVECAGSYAYVCTGTEFTCSLSGCSCWGTHSVSDTVALTVVCQYFGADPPPAVFDTDCGFVYQCNKCRVTCEEIGSYFYWISYINICIQCNWPNGPWAMLTLNFRKLITTTDLCPDGEYEFTGWVSSPGDAINLVSDPTLVVS